MAASNPMNEHVHETRPVPDPTTMTTMQLGTAILAIKELFATRLDAMDKGILLLQDQANRSPSINEVYLQHEERFKSVTQQFAERDQRFLHAHEADQKAIEAALKAAAEVMKATAERSKYLQDIHEEKFRSIGIQFCERDVRTALLQRAIDDFPGIISDAVDRLEALHAEKFASIAIQFAERDKRTEQLSIADKTAIAAALQAQKEAAGATNESNSTANTKTETNFSKLIDQTQALLAEVRRNTDEKINDVKSRLDQGEGRTSISDPAISSSVQALVSEVRGLKVAEGEGKGKAEGMQNVWAFILGGVGLLVGVAALIASFRPH